MRRAVLVTVLGVAAVLAGGCKKKKTEPEPYPLSTPSTTASGLSSRCDGKASDIWDLTQIKRYALHADGTPSRAAVFVRDTTSSTSRDWQPDTPKNVEPWIAGMYAALDAELTVCVDELEPQKSDPFSCSYYGAKVTMKGRDYAVKVVETSTGKVLADEKFSTDPRVSLCPGSVTGSYTDYGDWRQHVGTIVARFQPDAAFAKLPKAELDDLYEVCAGSGLPQAKKPGESGALKVVYFPTATTSFANEDVPKGLAMGSTQKDPSQYAYVMCVTGKPETKKASCDYLGTSSLLGIYDGTFQVELREARTGKIVETKTFTGTAGGCPDSYKFKGANDERIMMIEPAFRTYVQEVAAR